MKTILLTALLSTVALPVLAKKPQAPSQEHLIVCGMSMVDTPLLVVKGPVIYWELHTKEVNPYLEVQLPNQNVYHYMSAGETCSIRRVEEETGGSSRVRDTNA